MGHHLRIEQSGRRSLLTTRTRNSELWFVNNYKFEQKCLGYLAKYQAVYNVPIYAMVFQGNHYHLVAEFPELNRARFMRDFNSMFARLCNCHVAGYAGGSLWARRYAEQALPNNDDIEEYFFYCALQPVNAGLCERVSDYPGYNSFFDSISGRERQYEVVNWTEYNQKRRFDKTVKIKDFTKTYTLKFSRLPGYEKLSQTEYRSLMLKKLREREAKIIAERKAEGLGFMGRKALRNVVPGTRPFNTKKSTRYSFRPLVLSKCRETKRAFLKWYFAILEAYRIASKKYLAGDLTVEFPPGTYRPPSFVH